MKHRPDQELVENNERLPMDGRNRWRKKKSEVSLPFSEGHSTWCEKLQTLFTVLSWSVYNISKIS